MDPALPVCHSVGQVNVFLTISVEKDAVVVNVQQEILVTEKVLVEGLRFDLLVELPYPHLLKFVKMLQGYLLPLMLLTDV